MKEVSEEGDPFDQAAVAAAEGSDNSDYSGYHSDSDSTVMMSGNSPFISKSARYNFLSRSGMFNILASIAKYRNELAIFCLRIDRFDKITNVRLCDSIRNTSDLFPINSITGLIE